MTWLLRHFFRLLGLAFRVHCAFRWRHVEFMRAAGVCLDDATTTLFGVIVDRSQPARHGDLACWSVPFERNGQKQLSAAKLLLVVDGEQWLCSHYYAVKRTDGYHTEVGRVVASLHAPLGTRHLADAETIEWSIEDKRAKRANPPDRSDMVFFPDDLTDQAAIATAIRAHVRRRTCGAHLLTRTHLT